MSYFPVSIVGERTPLVSQEFRAPDHLGVDIMFRRLPGEGGGGSDAKWTAPRGAMAIAAADGEVLYARPHTNGLRVRLRHPCGHHTLYLHLRSLFVTQGQALHAGHVLGELGADPTDAHGLVHLHFEVRRPVLAMVVTPLKDGWDCVSVDPVRTFGWPWLLTNGHDGRMSFPRPEPPRAA